ncbi:MAG TPA: alanine racemase, partial [Saprospiraceae bacterium]|nr:alanine racemase [Saprospiraceae bacterium]
MELKVNEIAQALGINQSEGLIENESFIRYVSIDSRYILSPQETLFVALQGAHQDGHDFIPQLIQKGVRYFLVNRKMKLENAHFFYAENVLDSLQTLASFYRQKFSIPVIGITGSNGKTIVKEWLSELLNTKFHVFKTPKSYNSQIGVALSIFQMESTHQIAILEAGVSRTNEMEKLAQMIKPTHCILTNIGDAHDTGFLNRNEKLKEKLKLANQAQYLITNDSNIQTLHPDQQVICWGKPNSHFPFFQQKTKQNSTQLIFSFRERDYNFDLPFTDRAGIENATHAIMTALLFNCNVKSIQEKLNRFKSLPMRMEQIEGDQNCIIINDSYSLDLQSLSLALQFLDQQNKMLSKTIVISDPAELDWTIQDWKKIAQLLLFHQIRKLIYIGVQIKPYLSLFNGITVLRFDSTQEFIEQIDRCRFNHEIILVKAARKFALEKFVKEFAASQHDCILEIDLKAVVHNLNFYKKFISPSTKTMAVVKAAAYGTGAYEMAALMEFKQVDYLAVAYPDEGLYLRKKGIQLPIMVMNTGLCDYKILAENKLEPEIFSIDQLNTLVDFIKQENHPFPIHLKLDTGMHRLGIQKNEIGALIEILQSNSNLIIKSIFTHLSAGDLPSYDEFTRLQLDQFKSMANQITKYCPTTPILHALSTNSIARWKNDQMDMVRLGIGLYGLDSDGKIAQQL